MRLAVALLVSACAVEAHAHDFYSSQCCHGTDRGGDCEPLPFDAVTEKADGWRVDFIGKQGEVHEFVGRDDSRVLDSQDGRYHVCLRSAQYAPERIRCFYKAVNS
jgi:hypothetical protein